MPIQKICKGEAKGKRQKHKKLQAVNSIAVKRACYNDVEQYSKNADRGVVYTRLRNKAKGSFIFHNNLILRAVGIIISHSSGNILGHYYNIIFARLQDNFVNFSVFQ